MSMSKFQYRVAHVASAHRISRPRLLCTLAVLTCLTACTGDGAATVQASASGTDSQPPSTEVETDETTDSTDSSNQLPTEPTPVPTQPNSPETDPTPIDSPDSAAPTNEMETEENVDAVDGPSSFTPRDVDDISGSQFNVAGFEDTVQTSPDGVELLDNFGRPVTEFGINLLDWQGYLSNPYVRLTVRGPINGTYPLSVSIKASGTSRLMLNKPSELSSTGATKTVELQSLSDEQSFLIAIAPDRGGEFSIEQHELILTTTDAADVVTSQSVPLRVLDQDDAIETTSLPIRIDPSHDNLGGEEIFKRPDVMLASTLAIKDWFYFFDEEPFDEVPAGADWFWLSGDNFTNHEWVYNTEAYRGMWVYLRTISTPYSTGHPSNNGLYHTRNGVEVPGQKHRSLGVFFLSFAGDNLFTSMDDEQWYLSDPRKVTDIYTYMMHEFGHSFAYSMGWSGFSDYFDKGGATAANVIAYQGRPVPVSSGSHIFAGEEYWDRLSGQSSGWVHNFPERRWMLNKLTLLIASNAGWKIDKSLTPFLEPEILTTELPVADSGFNYRFSLSAQGGVPYYDWTVIEGALPDGFSLNRYTGTLKADPSVNTQSGDYTFTVRLRDSDELAEPVERTFSLTVR